MSASKADLSKLGYSARPDACEQFHSLPFRSAHKIKIEVLGFHSSSRDPADRSLVAGLKGRRTYRGPGGATQDRFRRLGAAPHRVPGRLRRNEHMITPAAQKLVRWLLVAAGEAPRRRGTMPMLVLPTCTVCHLIRDAPSSRKHPTPPKLTCPLVDHDAGSSNLNTRLPF